MSNDKDALEYFGQKVVEIGRDYSIYNWYWILDRTTRAQIPAEITSTIDLMEPSAIEGLRRLVPCIVDTTISNVLWMFEQTVNQVQVTVRGDEHLVRDVNIGEASDGLAGDYIDWIEKYSVFASENYR